MELLERVFAARGWTAFPFQREAWEVAQNGADILINAPTGTGKTLAALLAALSRQGKNSAHIIWLTPLRALATDLALQLQAFVNDLELSWKVQTRTGDTSSSVKAKQKKSLPNILVTTPESISLLLSYKDTLTQLEKTSTVVVDEWHELLGSKRGTQTELALARLRTLNPELQTIGLSATIGNLEQALDVLVGPQNIRPKRLIRYPQEKKIDFETLIPKNFERFPWFGHIGGAVVPLVIEKLENSNTSLVFTNTRNQAENWYQRICEARPKWEVALHHGSIDRNERTRVEQGARAGSLKVIVCTSSLDLGIDFPPVDTVFQIGSPKGIARLIQRAGRSGHRPDETSKLYCVPTNAFELVEFAAAKEAVFKKDVEARTPQTLSLDVLAQHLVTVALAGGFSEKELLQEVRTTHAFAALSDEQWSWVLEFASSGGKALKAYDEYNKLVPRGELYIVEDKRLARNHRMSIGTISNDSTVLVQFAKGGKLGSIEENFIAKLKPREAFIFSGRVLELVQFRDMKAFVRLSRKKDPTVPKWVGGRMPLSSHLSKAVRKKLQAFSRGDLKDVELQAVKPVLDIQADWSNVPTEDLLLVERTNVRGKLHTYLYPFEGRLVHEGLSALLTYRLAKKKKLTLSASPNDYGIELLSETPWECSASEWHTLLSTENLLEDILASLNSSELARRQFREIARVAGLIFQGYPGSKKTARQVQTSSGLLFDVFTKYDPENLLLEQAQREVLEGQLEFSRLQACLERIQSLKIEVIDTPRLTPLAFPLWAERQYSQASGESLKERIKRMFESLESAFDKGASGNSTRNRNARATA